MKKSKLIITGSSGFVGGHAIEHFRDKHEIVPLSYSETIPDIKHFTDVSNVFYFSGIAHALDFREESLYYKVNYEFAMDCAHKALKAGASNFVYLSSIKVYGDKNKLISLNTECAATDPYGLSKIKAEIELLKMQTDNFNIIIVRPSLIYGDNVKGNLRILRKLVDKSPFVPFKNINNKRSLVDVRNVLHLIEHLLENDFQGIYLSNDLHCYSTSEIVENLMNNTRVKIYFQMPVVFRKLLKHYKPELYKRLFESYIVDCSYSNKKANFIPQYSLGKDSF